MLLAGFCFAAQQTLMILAKMQAIYPSFPTTFKFDDKTTYDAIYRTPLPASSPFKSIAHL